MENLRKKFGLPLVSSRKDKKVYSLEGLTPKQMSEILSYLSEIGYTQNWLFLYKKDGKVLHALETQFSLLRKIKRGRIEYSLRGLTPEKAAKILKYLTRNGYDSIELILNSSQ